MIAKIMCGAPNGWFDEASLKDASISIGVDRGALVLVNQGIIPDIAIGDFDSIGECDYQKIQQLCSKVIKLPCEKMKQIQRWLLSMRFRLVSPKSISMEQWVGELIIH